MGEREVQVNLTGGLLVEYMFPNNDERGSLPVPYLFMLPATSSGFWKLWGRRGVGNGFFYYYHYRGCMGAVVNPEYNNTFISEYWFT